MIAYHVLFTMVILDDSLFEICETHSALLRCRPGESDDKAQEPRVSSRIDRTWMELIEI